MLDINLKFIFQKATTLTPKSSTVSTGCLSSVKYYQITIKRIYLLIITMSGGYCNDRSGQYWGCSDMRKVLENPLPGASPKAESTGHWVDSPGPTWATPGAEHVGHREPWRPCHHRPVLEEEKEQPQKASRGRAMSCRPSEVRRPASSATSLW